MMHINLERLQQDIANLLPDFKKAQDDVNAVATKAARDALIDSLRIKLQDQWMAMRDAMRKLSNNKCWYTESINDGCVDDIDHYRPKKSVREDPHHGGYYWLAFTPSNFRLSCQRANRLGTNPENEYVGGKSDHFPLTPESVRAADPSVDYNTQESPLLLDPTKERHPDVLTFLPGGFVSMDPEFEVNATDVLRFEKSREYYHLDWPDIREARAKLYVLIDRDVRRGIDCAPLEGTSSIEHTPQFNLIITDLRQRMDRTEAYSSAARAYLMGFRDIWWVRKHVLGLPRPQTTQGGGASSGVASDQAGA